MNCFDPTMSQAKYHADSYPPSLSSSIAKVLLTASPAHAYDIHPALGARPRTGSATQDRGNLLHALLLGTEQSMFAPQEADNYRKKEARDARDEAIASGKIPVLPHELEEAKAMADAFRKGMDAFGLSLSGGHKELACFWEQSGVQCRAMLDYLDDDKRLIIDLKSTCDANPDSLQRAIPRWGYDIQAHAYRTAVHAITGDSRPPEWLWIFCETSPPYVVTPLVPSESMNQLGRMRWERAVGIWQRCLESGKWPGYVEQVEPKQANEWAMARETEHNYEL